MISLALAALATEQVPRMITAICTVRAVTTVVQKSEGAAPAIDLEFEFDGTKSWKSPSLSLKAKALESLLGSKINSLTVDGSDFVFADGAALSEGRKAILMKPLKDRSNPYYKIGIGTIVDKKINSSYYGLCLLREMPRKPDENRSQSKVNVVEPSSQ